MTTTDTVEFPTPGPVLASKPAVALGMACSVGSFLVLVYCFDDVFLWLPKSEDLFRTLKVSVPPLTDAMIRYGRILWGLVALTAVLSVVQAFRHHAEKRTVAIQVAAFASTLILLYLARIALWVPLMSLLQGVGQEK